MTTRIRYTLLSLRDLTVSIGPFALLTVLLLALAYWWLDPNPPKRVVLATGPAQSAYDEFGKRYADALARYWRRELVLAAPQIMSLSQLARFASVADLMASARSRPPPLIEPEPFDQDGQRVICYPGDPRHSLREPAWPGPTRLIYRNRRFEPEDGLAALLHTP